MTLNQFSIKTRRIVSKNFETKTFQRGLRYAEQNRVQILEVGEWPVVAKVLGESSYVVTLFRNGEQYLEGECSCPIGFDCKHCVATALVALHYETRVDSKTHISRIERLAGQWLSNLGRQSQVLPKKTKTENRCIVYILEQLESRAVHLSFHRSSHLKKGGFGRSNKMGTGSRMHFSMPSWVSSEDRERMAMLQVMVRSEHFESDYELAKISPVAVKDLCDTGRLFWETVRSTPLAWGEPRMREFQWEACSEDTFQLSLGPDIKVLDCEETLYLDTCSSSIGTLDLGVTSQLVKELVRGPLIPLSMISTAQASLSCLPYRVPLPTHLGVDESEENTEEQACNWRFTPRFRVVVEKGSRFGDTLDLIYEAVYGKRVFPLGEWDSDSLPSEGRFARNLAEEGRCMLQAYFHTEENVPDIVNAQGKEEVLIAAQYLADVMMPSLLSQGWQCEFCDNFPAQMPIAESEWAIELKSKAESHGWFGLGANVTIDGTTVQLLPFLLRAIRSGEIDLKKITREEEQGNSHLGVTLRLSNGQRVYVSNQRLHRWLKPLIELQLRGLTKEGELLLPGTAAVDFAEQNPGQYAAASALEAIKDNLLSLLNLRPKKSGKGFLGELRPYQQKGHAWLCSLHKSGLGGLLADDMGLGKTVQVLAFLDGLRASRKMQAGQPILVVAPRSVANNWKLECSRFTPKLRCLVHLGANRSKSVKELTRMHLVITSYQTLLRDIEWLLDTPWTSIVLDEAQAIKNEKTKLRRAIVRLQSSSRFCISGTPIENNLGELWSQLDFVMPGILGSMTTFKTVFRTPIEKKSDSNALELLQRRIRPFMLRRSKSEVDIDLPEKIERIERVYLDTSQRDLYESLRLALDKDVKQALKDKGVEGCSFVVLDALLKLRQCCCDPRLVKIPEARKVRKSAKLERLMSLLWEIRESGRFVLVFSQFTSMLSLIETECQKDDIAYVKLTGQTRNRQKVIDRFQSGKVPVFLISLKAGGVGLNLTQADTVIHYDPWWNPAVERQATDRAHRIGQTRNVMVYKLVAEATVEEQICVLQNEKQNLTDATLSQGGLSHFSAKDLHSLFQSL